MLSHIRWIWMIEERMTDTATGDVDVMPANIVRWSLRTMVVVEPRTRFARWLKHP